MTYFKDIRIIFKNYWYISVIFQFILKCLCC